MKSRENVVRTRSGSESIQVKHSDVQSMANFQNCGMKLLPDPAHSRDMASSDFHLFLNLKKHFGGMKFLSNDGVQVAVNDYSESIK